MSSQDRINPLLPSVIGSEFDLITGPVRLISISCSQDGLLMLMINVCRMNVGYGVENFFKSWRSRRQGRRSFVP